MKLWIGIAALVLSLSFGPTVFAEPLDKEAALSLALKNNPRLSAALARIEGAEGERLQASLMPNPQAMLEIENFGGEDDQEGFDGAETTLGLEQEIEIAGKRGKRTEVADYGFQITQQQAIAEALSLLAETEYAFMRVAIATERLALAEKRVSLADETHETVKKRVSAAAASDIQHTKADIEQSAAKLEKSKAEAELAEAKSVLAALLGGSDLTNVQAGLEGLPALPDRAALLDAVRNTPQARAAEFAKMRATSQLDLARAQGVPNPTFGLGVRRFNENDSTALIAGVSFPLPVFNRNQGSVKAAKAGIIEADAMARQQDLDLQQSAIAAWEKLAAAHKEAEAYQSDMVPSAERAYSQASDGYSAGRFSFLDLLDAQRTLYEVQESRLDSLLSLYEAKAQTDFLMNVHAPLIQNIIQGDTK